MKVRGFTMTGSFGKRAYQWLLAAIVLCFAFAELAYAQSAEQSLFTTQTPVRPSASDGRPYELGMKFRPARSGQITAIRHWKAAGETGAHVGKIWSASGGLLASVTFTNETASGWQQQVLGAPLIVQANTTYVVSVNVQSSYPYTGSGLASPIVNGDISSIADGNNGVYANAGVFPSGSFQSSNYFRDIIFVADGFGPPAKLALSASAANAQTGTPVTYTATVQDAAGNKVATATHQITFSVSGVAGSFSPVSPISASAGIATTNFTATTVGTATITAAANGLTSASTSLAVASSSGVSQTLFTTQTPMSPNVTDGVPYELGMKFVLARSGKITAIRYWKAPSDSGTHVGRIWSAMGTLLASTTFTGETSSGWQQQQLASPLAVQANTTYVVSVNVAGYFPATVMGLASAIVNGDIASIADGSNAVFGPPFAFPSNAYRSSNYFRDIVFTADSLAAPSKLALSASATKTQIGVPINYTVTVQDASGNAMPGATNSISLAVNGVSGTFSPASPVAASGGTATFSFTPTTSGSAAITVSSTGLASATRTLTVSKPPPPPQSLFTTEVPTLTDATDQRQPYELGMKFQLATPGHITAIRYWKSPSDAGSHVGRIWSSTGVLLVSTPFTSETTSGWQQQALEQPLAVQANTTYVVSVNVQTHYPFTSSGLASSVVKGDISSIADGNNGVFGTNGAFPTRSYGNSNYFRDIVFAADNFGAPTKIGLVPSTASTQTDLPVSYTAMILDADDNVVTNAANAISFSVAGVSGTFDVNSPVTPSNGSATSGFRATTAGTATIMASAPGLVSATATLTVTQGSGAPVVIYEHPAAHSQGVAGSAVVTATFNESVRPASIDFKLTDAANNVVAAVLTYDDATHKATLQPNSPLAVSTTYTARVSGVADTAGNPMAGPVTWSFTTGSGELGQWSPVYNWPSVPIHVHLLPNGKVLAWADDDTDARGAGFTKTYVVDVPTDSPPGNVTYIPNTNVNLFCSGHSFLPDGRLITTGGHAGADQYGATEVVIFEDRNDQYGWFTQPGSMNAGRWYPSTVTMGTGEAVTFGGSEITGVENPLPQVWQTNSGGGLRDLTSAVRVVPWYANSHLAPNGKLFVAAPEQVSRYLDVAGTGQWTDAPVRMFGWRDAATSVMYDDGKVLVIGGSDPPTATAEIIDLNSPTPAWRYTGFMQFARRMLNATVLPDGKVLATGGTSSPGFSDATNSVFAAEMWDPATGNWTTMASAQIRRLYHSTAILLPDGRVMSGGGGRPKLYSGGVDNWNVEIFSPPYLFKGPRPTIASAPSGLSYGQTFAVQTPDAANIADVTFVRLSSVTHGFNMNQRFSRLSFTRTGDSLTVTAPSNRNLTPPGHYMMFILNSNGVPSIAKIVQIL